MSSSNNSRPKTRRRDAALLLVALLVLPAPADAHRRRNVQRTSPLATQDAGFAHAMSEPRTPIRVERFDDARVHTAVAYWNMAAQWELLVFSDDPEIRFRTDPAFCRWCALWDSYAPYTGCTVFFDFTTRNEWGMWGGFAHEIGHCLGFYHLERGMMRSQTHNILFDAVTLRLAGYRPCPWNTLGC